MYSIFKFITNKYGLNGLQLLKELEYNLKRKSVLIIKKIFLTRCLHNEKR